MKRKDRTPEISHSDRPGPLPACALAYLIGTYRTLSMTAAQRGTVGSNLRGARARLIHCGKDAFKKCLNTQKVIQPSY
jgi:hypothetical protein